MMATHTEDRNTLLFQESLLRLILVSKLGTTQSSGCIFTLCGYISNVNNQRTLLSARVPPAVWEAAQPHEGPDTAGDSMLDVQLFFKKNKNETLRIKCL